MAQMLATTFVPDHRPVAPASHWPRQQLRDVPFQAVVGGMQMADFTPRSSRAPKLLISSGASLERFVPAEIQSEAPVPIARGADRPVLGELVINLNDLVLRGGDIR